MAYKLVFLLALLFCICAAPIAAVRPLNIIHGLKLSKLSGDPLIQAACKGATDDECVSTLQSAPEDRKADANSLAFFALRFVENHAENITTGIKKISADGDVTPLLQSALTDCMDQYNSLDDLIEDAVTSILTNSYPDAQKFITAAISSIDLCDSQLNVSNFDEVKDNRTKEDVELESGLKKFNVLHKNLLSAALNILTIE